MSIFPTQWSDQMKFLDYHFPYSMVRAKVHNKVRVVDTSYQPDYPSNNHKRRVAYFVVSSRGP